MINKIVFAILLLMWGYCYAAHDPFFMQPLPARIKSAHSATQQAIHSTVIHLRYADAATFAKIISKPANHLLVTNGSVSIDQRTNSLWLRDSEAKIADIRRVLHQLDVPQRQILIQSYIVEVDYDYVKQLGISFNTQRRSQTTANDLTAAMPAQTAAWHLNLPVARLGVDTVLNVQLVALENEGHGRVISSPRLITQDRQSAYIESGEEIPYQEKAGEGATNVTFKKAVLSLKVTPIITAKQHVLLRLAVSEDKPSPITFNGVPAINTQKIRTQVLVRSGHTVVLGGIVERVVGRTRSRVPWLGRVPVIGLLFRRQMRSTRRRELLIFVTPTILATRDLKHS